MASHCPEEVLKHIFSYFELPFVVEEALPQSETSTPLTTLSAIALSSKKFCRIVRPILYKTLYIRSRLEHYLLIRSFCDNPALGWHVRNLKLCDTRRIYMPQSLFADVSPQLSFLAKLPRFKLPLDLAQGLLDAFQHNEDAFQHNEALAEAVLLLVFMPNLEELGLNLRNTTGEFLDIFRIAQREVSLGHGRSPSSFPSVLGETSATQLLSSTHFSNLRTVLLWGGSSSREEDEIDFTWLSNILGLPNLQKLSYRDWYWMGRPLSILPETDKLQHLEICFTNMRETDLANLISKVPELRSLKITINPEEEFQGVRRNVLKEIGDSLRTDGPRHLEELDISSNFEGFFPENNIIGIGSLRHLENLKKLRISLADLVGECVHELTDPIDPTKTHDGIRLMNLDAELPSSLEFLRLELINLSCGQESKYAHCQVGVLIRNEERTKLREVHMADEYYFVRWEPNFSGTPRLAVGAHGS
ncbi:hypothetical protein F4776DRAFT_305637 [Hypoxylon sp. NC0597]|nr:hypothetical protein F4776DRAFT_305637 [Hypoxylon sp. NC0597]